MYIIFCWWVPSTDQLLLNKFCICHNGMNTTKDSTRNFLSESRYKKSPITEVFILWDPAEKCLYYFTESHSPSIGIGSQCSNNYGFKIYTKSDCCTYINWWIIEKTLDPEHLWNTYLHFTRTHVSFILEDNFSINMALFHCQVFQFQPTFLP